LSLPPESRSQIIRIIVAVLIVFVVTYGSVRAYKNQKAYIDEIIKTHETQTQIYRERILSLEFENSELSNYLTDEQKRNVELEVEREHNERKIDTLEKLTTLDPELLKKYSKVYFLSENYNPPQLADIRTEYKITPDKDLK